MKGRYQNNIVIFIIVYFFIFPILIHAAQQKIKITAENAAVRAKPDIESQVIKLMNRGDVLELKGKTNEWFQVSIFLEDKGIEVLGYIHPSLVSEMEELSIEQEGIEKRVPEEKRGEVYSPEISFKKAQKRTWVGLKFKGGASYILADDINEGTQGFDSIWKNELSYPGAGIEGELTPFHIVYDFEADIIFYVFPNVGIGLGSGYLFGNQNNEMRLTLPSGEGPWVIRPELKVVPLKAGLYFLIPIGGESYFTLDAGAGWYNVNYNWYWRGENGSGYWAEMNQEASARDIGYHAGLGFEIGLGSHFAFLIEGRARYVEISGFEGTLEYKDSSGDSDLVKGKLYYWKEWIFTEKYTFVFISETDTPSFTGLTTAEHVREAVVDLTGFSLQAGFKIKF